MRWLLAAALVWAPTASGATIWLGHMKETITCPGVGTTFSHDDFTLDMEPGSGFGTLTIVGGAPMQIATDWMVEGRWGYFSASYADGVEGLYAMYGWIRGRRMKGYFVSHSYLSGCVIIGKLRGWL
jgi:hypothetical protein